MHKTEQCMYFLPQTQVSQVHREPGSEDMWQECMACAAAAAAPRPEFVAMADDDARNATFTKAEIPLSSLPASLHLSLDLVLVQVVGQDANRRLTYPGQFNS